MRGLTKTLVAVTLLTSTSVYSLGIGSIKLHSALNQKLNAEIALVASAGESIGDIHVKLASPAKFDEAGVPWSYFLSKIRFTPVVKTDGSIVVRLTSDETLKEPFLDFLVEVSGPSGSLYREFTVLVDPPSTYKHPTRFTESNAAVRTVSPQPVRQSGASSQAYHDATGLNATRIDDSGGQYGPVRKSDTIWSIANQVKTDDVSAAQMVMAIYAANPSAFSKANVNALSTGEMLTIPGRDAVLQLTPQQASTEFKQQGYRWRHGGTRSSTDRKTATPVIRHKQKHPPLDARSAYGNVKVAEPEPLTSAPALEGNRADKHELADALNNKALDEQSRAIADAIPATLEAESEEDIALKQRFERIEQQLQMMQKMLEQKDAQLLSLQAKQPAVNADAAPPAIEASAAPVISDVQPVKPLASAPASGNAPLALVEPEPMPVPASVVQAAPVQAAVALQTTPGDAVADYYLPGSGIGAGLLSLLGLVWWRRRKSEQEMDTESMFASASQISLPDEDKDASAASGQSSGYEVGMVGESAFLSEFTPSELDAFETDQVEIDPMSEADVYLAYGRYQQAEELIRQVIDEHPERNECKLKLLEIYQASENRLAFNQYIRQLISEGKQADSAFWAKVVEMADEFTPGSGALISGVDANESSPEVQVEAGDSLARTEEFKPVADHFDFDLSTLLDNDESASDIAVEPAVTFETAAAEQDGDFSLSMDFNGRCFGAERDEPNQGDSERVEKDAAQALDFDLNLFAAEPFSSFSAQEQELKFITEEDEGNTLNSDFDLSAFAAENLTADDEALAFMNENATNRVDFDLNAFTLENNAVADEALTFNEEDKDEAFDFNLSAFDEEFELAAQETVDRGSDADGQDDLSLNLEAIVFEKNSATAEIAAFAAEDSGDEFDVDFNLSAFAEEFERAAADISEGTGEDGESTLSSQVSAAPILTLVQNATQDDVASLSFEAVNEANADDRFNFDFSLDDDIYAKEAANKAEGGFSFNDESDDLPDFNFDFDFNLPVGDAAKKQEKRFEHVEVGGLAASDNSVETKINLAHAYVDMGDMDAAKVIADDLLTGTAEQKKSGQAILEKIS